MVRYIDAYKLEKDLPQSVPKHNVIINGNEYPVFLIDHILHKIRNYPTADVVEVVRCCDCKHRQENPDINNTCYLTCNNIYGIQGTIEPDDYCSYGERK